MFTCLQKFGDLVPTIDEKRRPQIWTCFWARRRNKSPEGNCDFLSTKCFINVYRSLWTTDCAEESLEARNLELCFGTNVGTNRAKIDSEKISISRAILLGFLRSLVSVGAIRCEANKINWRREERTIGSRAVKMLRGLRFFTRAVSRSLWRLWTRALKWEHVCTTGRYDDDGFFFAQF